MWNVWQNVAEMIFTKIIYNALCITVGKIHMVIDLHDNRKLIGHFVWFVEKVNGHWDILSRKWLMDDHYNVSWCIRLTYTCELDMQRYFSTLNVPWYRVQLGDGEAFAFLICFAQSRSSCKHISKQGFAFRFIWALPPDFVQHHYPLKQLLHEGLLVYVDLGFEYIKATLLNTYYMEHLTCTNTYMQFLAARSLWMIFCSERYFIPFAICKQINSNCFCTFVTFNVKIR